MPAGLGEPVFDVLMSAGEGAATAGAVKGVEIGETVQGGPQPGELHNDAYRPAGAGSTPGQSRD